MFRQFTWKYELLPRWGYMGDTFFGREERYVPKKSRFRRFLWNVTDATIQPHFSPRSIFFVLSSFLFIHFSLGFYIIHYRLCRNSTGWLTTMKGRAYEIFEPIGSWTESWEAQNPPQMRISCKFLHWISMRFSFWRTLWRNFGLHGIELGRMNDAIEEWKFIILKGNRFH